MIELINRDELLKRQFEVWDGNDFLKVVYVEDIEDAPSVESCYDCISREQAINALNLLREMSKLVGEGEKLQPCIDTMEGILTDLPSVLPKVKQGHCGSYMKEGLDAISD